MRHIQQVLMRIYEMTSNTEKHADAVEQVVQKIGTQLPSATKGRAKKCRRK